MVRRLIQNFLHWLQPPETQVRESEHDCPSPSPQPPLPPSQQQPPEPHSSQTQSDVVPTPPPSNVRPDVESSSLEQLIQPPAPAAAQASNFKVLLSDYRYSPNPAIQDLSQQLSQPFSQSESLAPASPSNAPGPDLSGQALPDLEHRFSSNTDSLLNTLKTKQESSPAEISTTHINQRVSHNHDVRVAESGLALDLTTDHISQPETLKTEPQPAFSETAAETEIITKQGVVKLLFKLKQNNHHGYIAPNDGSKDIIFHQKYVGYEIFHQLERGMAVEVTAHVTAGKAYADHVRIL